MATAGIVEGKVIGIYDGSNLIAYSTSGSLSISTDMREITNKDTALYKDFLPVRSGWEISGEFLFAFDATYGFEDIWDKMNAGTAFSIKFQSASSGDLNFEGLAYASSLEVTASDGDNVTFSATWQGAGTLSKETV